MHKTRNSLRSFRDKIYISHVCLSLVVILVLGLLYFPSYSWCFCIIRSALVSFISYSLILSMANPQSLYYCLLHTPDNNANCTGNGTSSFTKYYFILLSSSVLCSIMSWVLFGGFKRKVLLLMDILCMQGFPSGDLYLC